MRWLRAHVGWVILAFILAWPPIHMLLARRYHFSPWRYGGFGMYAAPDGSDREVHVFMSSCRRGDAPPEPAGRTIDRKLGFYYIVNGPRLDAFSLPELEPNERRALAQRIRDLRSLSRRGDFERLAAWIDARLSPASSSSSALGILVAEPHLDVRASVAYAEVFGFIREQGRWSPVGPLRGPAALASMVARLGICP